MRFHHSISTPLSPVRTAPLISTDNSIHSILFPTQGTPQPLAEESLGSWLAESALQQLMRIDRAIAVHEGHSLQF
jgi:hypothetical protein